MKTWLQRVKDDGSIDDLIYTSSEGDETINHEDENGLTPLQIAIQKKLAGKGKVSLTRGLDMIDLLIDHGVVLEESVLEDLYPHHLDLLFRILQRGILEASFRKTDRNIFILLNLGAKFFSDTHPLLNEMCFKDGRFPLHCAVAQHDEILVLIMMDMGAACDLEDQNSQTPLAFARTHNPSLFYKMLKKLWERYPITHEKWLLGETDYILEEMIRFLSPTLWGGEFSSLTRDAEWRHSIFLFAGKLPKKDLTRTVLRLGNSMSVNDAIALKAEILNIDEKKRSLLAQLFWAARKMSACHVDGGELAEIAKKLIGNAKPSLRNYSIFQREKTYAHLDFKEFVVPILAK